jgi:tRNA(Ile)-lysidine synthase
LAIARAERAGGSGGGDWSGSAGVIAPQHSTAAGCHQVLCTAKSHAAAGSSVRLGQWGLAGRLRGRVAGAHEVAAPERWGELWRVSTSLAGRLRRHLGAHRLFPEPGEAVLAVSGGADSLALLDLLATLAPELGLALVVAHADHGIAPGSDAVARGVADLAAGRYGVGTVTGALSLGAGASETRARTARYRFLRGVQEERGARYLVTAHHADDQVETVLLRVVRGSAPPGRAGLAARGPHGLVRPLLPFRRDELREHVLARGLAPFDDPANRDVRHLRSWLRAVLVPAIVERLGDGGPEALLQVARHARAEARAWDAALDALPGLDARVGERRFDVAREALSGYDKCLAARILRSVAARAGLALTPRAASRLAAFARGAGSGRRMALPAGLVAEVAFARLVVSRPAAPSAPLALGAGDGACAFGRYRLTWRAEPAPARLERAAWTTWLMPGAVEVRAARDGDRLVPLGGAGRRKVSRLLMEARVPRGERAAYPVIAARGAVAWVPGVCRGAGAVPEPGTDAMRVDVAVR